MKVHIIEAVQLALFGLAVGLVLVPFGVDVSSPIFWAVVVLSVVGLEAWIRVFAPRLRRRKEAQ
jgi:hypothetical protein